jgi:hypothetical protein
MNKNYLDKVRGKLKDLPTYEKFSTLINMGHDINFIKEVYPYLIYTFDDLKFNKHSNDLVANEGGKQAKLIFDNGHWVSVVGGASCFYGDGVNNFEVGYPISKNDMDVIGYLSPDEVTDFIIKTQMKNPF